MLVLPTGKHRDLAAFVADYEGRVGGPPPVMACVALAGPVTGDRCRTTNGSLDFSISETAATLGLERLEVINDFAAVALGVSVVSERHTVRIGAAAPQPYLPILVLGPGTGLGMAAVVPLPGGESVVLPGEGGHAAVPVSEALELELVRMAGSDGQVLTSEMLLSGPGLTRLHGLLGRIHGAYVDALAPEEICARAVARTDQMCAEALSTFCRLLGAVSANAALTTGARGGVYLAGGILPRIADFLYASGFRTRFESHPLMTDYLAGIATVLITDPYPGLLGAAIRLNGLAHGI